MRELRIDRWTDGQQQKQTSASFLSLTTAEAGNYQVFTVRPNNTCLRLGWDGLWLIDCSWAGTSSKRGGHGGI
jgi:hypothetical protein